MPNTFAVMLPVILPRTTTDWALMLPLITALSPRLRTPSDWISPSNLPSNVSSPVNLRLPLISTAEVNRPGLQLTGYLEAFSSDRLQIIGWIETAYLSSLEPGIRAKRLDDYFALGRTFVAKSDSAWFDSAGGIYQGMINQVSNAYENTDGTPIPLGENDVAKGVFDQVIKAGVDDELSARLGQWSEDWTNAFQNDGFATMLCPSWMLGVIEGNAAGVKGWDIADTFPGGGGNWGGSFLTVPTQGDHPEEAQALAAWLTAPEQQIKAFVAKGTFPSQVEALSSPDLLTQKSAFFNDAPTGEIMSNRAEAVTVAPFKGANYFAIQQLVSDAINRVEVDQTDDAASSWEKAVTGFEELGLS